MSIRTGIPTRKEFNDLLHGVIELSDDQFCDLIEIMLIYADKFKYPSVSANQPVHFATDWIGFDAPRQAECLARRATVEAVQEIWREAGANVSGIHYDSQGVEHSGELISLLIELFKLVTIGDDLPSEATLFHDLEFINSGIERQH